MADYTEKELDAIYRVFERVNRAAGPGTLPERSSNSLAVPQGVFGLTDTANNITLQSALHKRIHDVSDRFAKSPRRVEGLMLDWFAENAEPDPLPRDPRIKFYNDMASQLEYVDRLGRALEGTGGDLETSAQIAREPENLEAPYPRGGAAMSGPLRVELDPRNNMSVRPLFRGSVQIRKN